MNIQCPGCGRHHPLPPALDASVLRARCICGQALAFTSAETPPGPDDAPPPDAFPADDPTLPDYVPPGAGPDDPEPAAASIHDVDPFAFPEAGADPLATIADPPVEAPPRLAAQPPEAPAEVQPESLPQPPETPAPIEASPEGTPLAGVVRRGRRREPAASAGPTPVEPQTVPPAERPAPVSARPAAMVRRAATRPEARSAAGGSYLIVRGRARPLDEPGNRRLVPAGGPHFGGAPAGIIGHPADFGRRDLPAPTGAPPMEIPTPATRRLPSGALIVAAALALLALLPGLHARWGGGGDEQYLEPTPATVRAPVQGHAAAPAREVPARAWPGSAWIAPASEPGAVCAVTPADDTPFELAAHIEPSASRPLSDLEVIR